MSDKLYKGRKAQSWSTDLILGVVIFLLIITVIYTLSTKDKTPRSDLLQQRGEEIVTKLDSSTGNARYPVIQEGQIDEQTVETVYGKSFDDLKKDLQVDGKYCIFMEDEQGRIVVVGGKTGVGSDELSVSGYDCGEPIS